MLPYPFDIEGTPMMLGEEVVAPKEPDPFGSCCDADTDADIGIDTAWAPATEFEGEWDWDWDCEREPLFAVVPSAGCCCCCCRSELAERAMLLAGGPFAMAPGSCEGE